MHGICYGMVNECYEKIPIDIHKGINHHIELLTKDMAQTNTGIKQNNMFAYTIKSIFISLDLHH